jgi:adenosylcobinamide-GDP ribazoletransferase
MAEQYPVQEKPTEEVEGNPSPGSTGPGKPSPQPAPSGLFTVFLTGIQFLLISPAFIKRPFTPQELGGATAFYPLVGAILGGLLIGLDWLLSWFFPLQVRSALVLAAWVFLTGALHLDGFLDSCDGLLGGFTPEQRLEIMRDERVGAYALSGGILLMLVNYSALNSLSGLRWPALLLAPVLGRLAMTLAVWGFPYARPKGLGREIKDNVTNRQAGLAGLFTGLIIVIAALLMGSPAPLFALAAGLLACWGLARFILNRIPGLTGDSYGAINTLVEMVVLLVMVAF